MLSLVLALALCSGQSADVNDMRQPEGGATAGPSAGTGGEPLGGPCQSGPGGTSAGARRSGSFRFAAQPEGEEQPRKPGRRGGRGQGGRGERRPPMMPVMSALDANHDHTLDASEIANASAALLTLDKNGDGALTLDELRPQRPNRGEEGGAEEQSPRPGKGREGGDPRRLRPGR